MSNTPGFWNWMSKRYAKSPVADEQAYQKKLAITQSYFVPDSTVLEFGCGTGSTAIAHAPYVKDYLATDFSKAMLDIARGKAAGIENLRFEECRLEDVSRPEGGFDVVMGHSILHLLEDRDVAITQAYGLLKPGGVFVSSTVTMGKKGIGASVLKALLSSAGKIGVLPLIRFFTVEDLINSHKNAGFEIDHCWEPRVGESAFIVARKPA